jgi:transposase
VIRSLLCHRESLVQVAAAHVQPMQKAPTQMNLPIHLVLSDIPGQSGLAILDAIVKGERNPLGLAQLRDQRVKAREEGIVKSLVGDYRREHLFSLGQSLEAFRYYQGLMAACDEEIEELPTRHPCRRRPTLTDRAKMSFAWICVANGIIFSGWT